MLKVIITINTAVNIIMRFRVFLYLFEILQNSLPCDRMHSGTFFLQLYSNHLQGQRTPDRSLIPNKLKHERTSKMNIRKSTPAIFTALAAISTSIVTAPAQAGGYSGYSKPTYNSSAQTYNCYTWISSYNAYGQKIRILVNNCK